MTDSSSSLRAEVNPKFKYKFLLIGSIALAVGLWHFIDPIFNYPAMRPASEAYATLKEQLTSGGKVDDGALQRQWEPMAKENGWEEGVPKYMPHELTTNTIYSYFIGVLFTFIAGIPCLITFIRCLGQWIGVEGDGLVNAKGQKVAFSDINVIDKSKWEKKGIARLMYSDGGSEKSFVIDDLKFDRETTDQIMALVEDKVGIDRIQGALSEAEYRKLREEAEAEKARRRAEEEAEEEEEHQES